MLISQAVKHYTICLLLGGTVGLLDSCQFSGSNEQNGQTAGIRRSMRLESATLIQEVTFPNMPFERLYMLKEIANGKIGVDSVLGTASVNVLLFPLLKTEIRYDAYQAVGVSEGLTYRLEHLIDTRTESGKAHLESKSESAQDLSFHYTLKDLDVLGKLQIKVDPKKYTIDKTGQTKEIAGVVCQQSIYTKIDKRDSELPRFIIWKSPRIPQVVNSLHPYVFRENEGILEIEAYLNKDDQSLVRYSTSEIRVEKFEPKNYRFKSSTSNHHEKVTGSRLDEAILKVVLSK